MGRRAVRQQARWGKAPRLRENERRRVPSRGWEEKRKGKKRRGKGELFRFLTISERRRLSARPTRDSYVRSLFRFFFFSRALADIEIKRS